MNRRIEKAFLAARQRRATAEWKQKLALSTLRKLTWRERLLLLLGYNLRCEVELLTEHGPGRVAHKITHTITRAVDPESAVKEQLSP